MVPSGTPSRSATLGVAEARVERERERVELGPWEPSERAQHPLTIGLGRDLLLGRRGRYGGLERDDLVGDRAPPLAATRAVDRRVSHERDEPRDDRALVALVLPRALVQRHEGVVEHVLGLGSIAEDAERDREENRGMTVVEGGDGARISPTDPLHELRVVVLTHTARRLPTREAGVKKRRP
jgi:hypothetical protein